MNWQILMKLCLRNAYCVVTSTYEFQSLSLVVEASLIKRKIKLLHIFLNTLTRFNEDACTAFLLHD